MKKENFIPFGRPNLGSEENRKIKNVLKSSWIGTGPLVHQFEKIFLNTRILIMLNH